jgi:hypothetical protein
MRKIITVTVAFVALTVSNGTAHADNPDQAFLNAVAAQGISGDPAQMIAAGHAACANYGGPALVAQMTGLMAQGLTIRGCPPADPRR